jgi:hypothetical protein
MNKNLEFPFSRAKGHQSALGFKAPSGTPRYRSGLDNLRQNSVGISAKKKESHSDKEPPQVYCSSRYHVIPLYPRSRLFTLGDTSFHDGGILHYVQLQLLSV